MTDPELTIELARINKKLDNICDLLLGNGLKEGWVVEHQRLMKSTFGDDADPVTKPGLVREVKSLQSFKAWITHTVTAIIAAAGTAVIGWVAKLLF
jgi:hypothetical protein